MSVSLGKGGNVSLSKTDPSMRKVLVGLGWDARSTDGQDFDLDASAFLLSNEILCFPPMLPPSTWQQNILGREYIWLERRVCEKNWNLRN